MCHAESDYSGRPYGGVSIICNLPQHFSSYELPSQNDRFIAIAVQDQDRNIVQIIASVYMPYYGRSKYQQTVQFMDTLDALQVLIDEFGAMAPIKLCGDWNTSLPRMKSLANSWYKEKGFTYHSQIL